MHLVRPLPLDTRPLPPGTSVRPLGPDDHRAVAALSRVAQPAAAALSAAEAEAELREVLGGAFGTPLPGAMLVALASGGVVGCVQTVVDPPWDAPSGPYLLDLFVHPDARGRGVGEGLVGAAASALWADGHVSLGLTIDPDHAFDAFRLYARLGFRALG